MLAAFCLNVPTRVFWVHGLPHVSAQGAKRHLLWWSTRITCALAHKVFCVSASMRSILVQEELCAAHKIVVPANGSSCGVDANVRFNPALTPEHRLFRTRYNIPDDAVVFAFVGRLVRDKGILELCRAWKVVQSTVANAYLVVAGEFEDQDPVPLECSHILCGGGRIKLVGYCNDTSELYASADVVVLPTYREGLPDVLLEAAAMGLPVVATAVPGCTDIVRDGHTGTLVPAHDPMALAAAMTRYAEYSALRQRHGERARDHVLRYFRPESIWEAVEHEYVSLVRARRRSLDSTETAPFRAD
jgi:glycosyltransferase involved in cell wall biosynthesis